MIRNKKKIIIKFYFQIWMLSISRTQLLELITSFFSYIYNLQKVNEQKPDFLAVHCQEVGGKTYEESMKHVEDFIR